jgi:hypothetical protein
MPLKQLMLLLGSTNALQQTSSATSQTQKTFNFSSQKASSETSQKSNDSNFTVNISKDVDDDQIHGPRRRRKKKARTNTR